MATTKTEKEYRVSIAAYVPANVEIVVNANNPSQAYQRALEEYDEGNYDIETVYESGLRFNARDEYPSNRRGRGVYIAVRNPDGSEDEE